MLKKLSILNGELSVKFDSQNTRYTVNMTSADKELKIEYIIDEDDKISIFNNELNNDLTEVVITVYNDKEMMSYYLEVYKMLDKTTSDVEEYFDSLQVNSATYMPNYIAPLIGSSCFLIILFFFTFLFKSRKK